MRWTYEQCYGHVSCVVCGEDIDAWSVNNTPSESVCIACGQKYSAKVYEVKQAKEAFAYVKKMMESEEYLQKQITFQRNLHRRESTLPSGNVDGDRYKDLFGQRIGAFK